jgi:hypothetical protein
MSEDSGFDAFSTIAEIQISIPNYQRLSIQFRKWPDDEPLPMRKVVFPIGSFGELSFNWSTFDSYKEFTITCRQTPIRDILAFCCGGWRTSYPEWFSDNGYTFVTLDAVQHFCFISRLRYPRPVGLFQSPYKTVMSYQENWESD